MPEPSDTPSPSLSSGAGAGDVDALRARAREAIDALAACPDPAAFHALLVLSEEVGLALATSARTLAAGSSWSQVAAVSGTTKQAAWARWHQ